jgi:hypothetical protein
MAKTQGQTPVPQQSANDILAELLLQEKAEAAQKREEEKQKYAMLLQRRKASEMAQLSNQDRIYANCDHLQGNHKNGESPFKEVTHMSLHTFADNTMRIRCNKCGFRWFPGDTDEFIVRDGVKLNNPTSIGWKQAKKTVQKYTNMGNKPSTGFITVTVTQQPSGD